MCAGRGTKEQEREHEHEQEPEYEDLDEFGFAVGYLLHLCPLCRCCWCRLRPTSLDKFQRSLPGGHGHGPATTAAQLCVAFDPRLQQPCCVCVCVFVCLSVCVSVCLSVSLSLASVSVCTLVSHPLFLLSFIFFSSFRSFPWFCHLFQHRALLCSLNP